MTADRNLLFGVVALRRGVIDAAQFAEACAAWAACQTTPLADLLVERGILSTADRSTIEWLVAADGPNAATPPPAADHARRALALLGDPSLDAAPAGPDDPPDHDTTPAGRRDRYALTALHARGGIGQVWVAGDDRIGRAVALKELRPDREAVPAAAARFLAEARVTGQLEHPGIVPVYDLVADPADGRPYYTMRFVRGRTLAAATADYHASRRRGDVGPLEFPNLLQTFVRVCEAVGYANARGVVHRDLKGANVALGDYGEVLVLDWGLAKILGATDDANPTTIDPAVGAGSSLIGQVLGTPAYMAPEQARGDVDTIDGRTDVYGLGAILYELLAGRPPFAGADAVAVLRQVRETAPTSPEQANSSAPAALVSVCRKAMAKAAADRYATAGALANDVRRWLADEPIAVHRDPVAVRLRRWAKRHRTMVAAAAAGLTVAVLGLAAATALLNAAYSAEQQAKDVAVANGTRADAARADAETQRDRAEAGEGQARQAQYVAQVRAARQAWEGGDVNAARRLLGGLAPPAGKPDLRGFEWRHLRALAYGGPAAVLDPDVGPVRGVAYAPDGAALAVAGEAGAAVWNPAARQPRFRLTGHAGGVHAVAFSPDGTLLTTAGDDGTVRFWDGSTGEPRRTARGHRGAVTAVAFAPDGRTALSAGTDATLRRWAVAGDDPPAIKLPPAPGGTTPGQPNRLAVTPDGRRAAVAGMSVGLLWVDLAAGTTALSIVPSYGTALAMSPDGATLVSGGPHGDADGLDVATMQTRRSFPGHRGNVDAAAIAPDGRTLYTATPYGAVRVFDAESGAERPPLRGHTDGVTALAVAPGSREVASGSRGGVIHLWDVGPAAAGRLVGQVGPVCGLAFVGPDRLVTAGGGAEALLQPEGPPDLRAWDAGTGRPTAIVQGAAEITLSVAYAPDGRTVAVAAVVNERGRHPVGRVELRDAAGAVVGQFPEVAGLVAALAFSPDGRTLAAGVVTGNQMEQTDRGRVVVWDVAKRQVRWSQPAARAGVVTSLCFSPDGAALVGAGFDIRRTDRRGEVRVWDAATGADRGELDGFADQAFDARYTPDGRTIVTAHGDIWRLDEPGAGAVRFWDAATRQLQHTARGPGAGVMCAVPSPDGRRVLAAGAGGAVLLDTAAPAAKPQRVATGPFVAWAAFAPDGRRFATAEGFPGDPAARLRLWDAGTGAAAGDFAGPGQEATQVAFAPDGGTLAAATNLGGVRLWDVESRTLRRALDAAPALAGADGHASTVTAVAATADGRTIATGGHDKTIRIWDAETWRLRRTLTGHTAGVHSLAFAPNGRTLASAAGDRLRSNPGGEFLLWDVDSGERIVAPPGDRISAVTFAPDGATVAVAVQADLDRPARRMQPGRIRLFDVARRVVRTEFVVPSAASPTSLAYSPDGNRLAVGSFVPNYRFDAASVVLVDAADGRHAQACAGLFQAVWAVAFAPDGKTVAAAGQDGEVRLWHAGSGEALAALAGHTGPVYGLTFSPDGRTLASGGTDGFAGDVRLWRAPDGLQIAKWTDPGRVGYARVIERAADRSEWTEMSFFDAVGKPATDRFGVSRVTVVPNVTGERVERRFRDAPAPLVGFDRRYDVSGRIASDTWVDVGGRTVLHPDCGWATVRPVYDRDGREVDATFADATGRPVSVRVVIARVTPRSQADSLGLQAGDAIVAYAGRDVTSVPDFLVRRAGAIRGELIVERDGVRHTVTAAPGALGIEIRPIRSGTASYPP